MLNHRNLMSHTYDCEKFEEAVAAVRARYLGRDGTSLSPVKNGNRPTMSYGLSEVAVKEIQAVLARHSAIDEAVIFGSRALGHQHSRSDIDIVLGGDLAPLQAEAIALELDELPLPLQFDVHVLNTIRHQGLRDHIARAGQILYRRLPAADAAASPNDR